MSMEYILNGITGAKKWMGNYFEVVTKVYLLKKIVTMSSCCGIFTEILFGLASVNRLVTIAEQSPRLCVNG
jgi:hypothetical protein